MQTLSSQSTTTPPLVSQKQKAFEDPLARTELKSPAEHPFIQQKTATPAVVHMMAPRQNEPTKNDRGFQDDKKKFVAPPPQNKTAPPPKRQLPDEIRAIFESNSKDFVTYAKKEEKKPSSLNEGRILDIWDKALLLEEDPSPKKPAPFVPKKTNSQFVGQMLPSRVMDAEVPPPVVQEKNIPLKRAEPLNPSPQPKVGVPAKPIPPATIIPQKPKTAPSTPAVIKIETVPPAPMSLKIPTKPQTIVPAKPPAIPAKPKEEQMAPSLPQTASTDAQKEKLFVPPATNMSETLVEKIIEGQMRGVFENAPPLLQKELEKVTVREILTLPEQTTSKNLENEVWKKRLREYLTKLQEQALSVFPDTVANPGEEELVLDYVKRVYPLLLKAQVTGVQ